MRRVRAFTHHPDSIQRRNAKRCSEVAIGSAAGRRLFKLDIDLPRQTLRHRKELLDALRPLHGRPVQTALYDQ